MLYIPITSAFCVDAMNHASSPNLPNLYLERKKSFGNPHATDTKWGLTFVLGSTSVENPLRNARENRRVVQQIDCITFLLLSFLRKLISLNHSNQKSISLKSFSIHEIRFVFRTSKNALRTVRVYARVSNFFLSISLLQRRCTITLDSFFRFFFPFYFWRVFCLCILMDSTEHISR